MRKPAAISLLLVLLASLVTPVYAAVIIRATIGQNIHIVLSLENLNSSIYNEIVQQHLFNVSTIPQAILQNLEQRGLEDAECVYDPSQNIFNNSAKSIHVELLLIGQDVVHITINKTTMNKIYNVRTNWRKFQVNLTDSYSLDFNDYFGSPLVEWKLEDKTMPIHYYYSFTSSNEFDPACYFILPSTAINPQVAEDGDTLLFELPLSVGESMLSSPLLILVALIIVNLVAIFYRRVRRVK
ncbi:MAG: hypothetical protein JSV85_02680 [Candidatus Bathyarchaeota archaeon]|nr:MAG: hypothetical protein JSV85_02680 [Candidatus Bathyarchaeota archaeon]